MIAASFQMSDELEKSLTHIIDSIFLIKERWSFVFTKLLQKSEMRKDIVIELSYKGFS